jgi:osmotically-inducible protein OsmY
MLRFAACCLLAALLGAGCTTYPGGEGLSEDGALAQDVTYRLLEDDVTARLALGVTAENGVIILRGSVPNDMVRARAIGIALGTPGVMEVIDELYRR